MIVTLIGVKIGNKSRKKAHGMATEASYLRVNLYLGFCTAAAVWYLHLPKVCISSETTPPDLLHPDLFVYKLRGEAETIVWDYFQCRTSLYLFASFYNQVLQE